MVLRPRRRPRPEREVPQQPIMDLTTPYPGIKVIRRRDDEYVFSERFGRYVVAAISISASAAAVVTVVTLVLLASYFQPVRVCLVLFLHVLCAAMA